MNVLRKSNRFIRTIKYLWLINLRKLKKLDLQRYIRWGTVTAVTIILIGVFGYKNVAQAKTKAKEALIPVVVATATTKDVPIYINALGSVTPTATVTVKTQIDGQLLQIFFEQGQMVTAGERLAQIDPRPYLAQLNQYKGQLARDLALLANAFIDLDRYKTLLAQDSIAKQTVDTQEALVKQYQGIVSADKGQIEAIQLNLKYCDIISPVTGRAGFLQVDPGNYVQTSDANGIVIVNSISPIYIAFAIPEDALPTVMRKVTEGTVLPVTAKDRTQNELLAEGFLNSVDNQIDPTTGTIKLRGMFHNETGLLVPNQFVNIMLQTDVLHDAIVVPTPAVQYGVNGTFVYVLNADQTVNMQTVTVTTTNDTEAAITGDIKAGQIVIIEGTDKIKTGTKVAVTNKQTTTSGKFNT